MPLTYRQHSAVLGVTQALTTGASGALGGRRKGSDLCLGGPSVSLGRRTPGSPGRRVEPEAHTRAQACLSTPGNSGPLCPFWTTTRRPPGPVAWWPVEPAGTWPLMGGLALWRPSREGRGAAELPLQALGNYCWDGRLRGRQGTSASAGQSLLQGPDESGAPRSAAPAFSVQGGEGREGPVQEASCPDRGPGAHYLWQNSTCAS